MLPSLMELRLSGCELGHSSPHLSMINFTSLAIFDNGCVFDRLESLHLAGNELKGSIPSVIGNFTSIISLNLEVNQFEGKIDHLLRDLCRLRELWLGSNNFSGTMFESSERFPCAANSLEELRLNDNQLNGQLTNQLGLFGKLILLEIYNNSFSGSIPLGIGKFSNLQYFDASRNQLNGSLPESFGQLAKLEWLDISDNSLEAYPLEMIDLSFNHFNGSMPTISSVTSVEPFTAVFMGNNLLSEAIPECWNKWEDLLVIRLENNNLFGNIPSSIGYLTNLQSLHLHNNSLYGGLPLSLQNCTSLVTVDLGENKFVGKIPQWIGTSLSGLRVLSLHSNKFHGDIPLELCNLTQLQILDLAHNNLSGSIPKCFSNLSSMNTMEHSEITFSDGHAFESMEHVMLVTKGREAEYSNTLYLVASIDLSDNNLSGHIPSEITRLFYWQTLNLSQNQLTGKIPSEVGDMRCLESLDLSRNKLSGEIPSSISNLTFLSHLNLSFNNLSGHIPTGTQLQSLDESSFIGNQLCGPPLQKSCSSAENITPPGVLGGQGNSGEVNYLHLSLGLGFAFGFWSVLGSLLINMPWTTALYGLLDRLVLKLYGIIFEYF
ncbi:hypothetical protein FEM48_Zijuj07G0011900 [Ziziphus jujuba var. spinosa]|uniref:Receptor-like protein EIX2 n=1 Tax=Ziziphus jujuba var. spinosa TaxID=714518 RepID=A0A978V1K5_ZIZJJ|nr:hypothetical protein FEM48_Zijuj07G0011900 [Ziziphus jujuba var. spinosa]